MLIVGAGGHAIEILNEFKNYSGDIAFYDNVTRYKVPKHFNHFPILQSDSEVIDFFQVNNKFCLGIGNPLLRMKLHSYFENLGGSLCSVISENAQIGNFECVLGNGLNIMSNAVLTNSVNIGLGVILHIHVSIHHNVSIGNYSEISPGARILGGANIGDFVSVGANAVVLPNVVIGNNTIIAAGAVVTKNIPSYVMAAGTPAVVKKIFSSKIN